MKKFILALLFTCLVFAQDQKTTLSADEALDKLVKGNQHWVENKLQFIHQNSSIRYKTAKEGQHPFATILTCSDSRVSPELIFDQGVGDLFVIRVAGNVVDTDELASIEYGVEHLETPVLLVLGHSGCGAVTAAYKSWKHKTEDTHSNIPELLHKIEPAIKKSYKEHPDLGEKSLIDASVSANVRMVIDNILKMSEGTKKKVLAGKLKVVGAVYNTYHGHINWLFTPDDVLKILRKGNQHWSSDKMQHPHHSIDLRHIQAVEGQLPIFTIITCSDSRVIPELIFDQGVGDAFVIRVAGNILGGDELASIEYGVKHLQTPLLLVLGHSSCGAVTAALDHVQHPDHEQHGNIPKLISKIEPAVREAQKDLKKGENLLDKSIVVNVRTTHKQIIEKSEAARKQIAEGRLKIVSAVYNIETGKVEWLDD
ncbi:carbonic anhydrase [Candidatus Uabimicrobium amorphum]|uniref:carbonic anhydrase n=1 Tax=Uabimicrobium amorphum TaxID=2596890 RepID=A0A5S9IRS0_UABAM|nr:carbonic anhydrase [Candidatus Uabimicrobium amorphum]BBM86517.1 carbonic anhydrase [Candidatus Uabimicrobium amorphum]